MQAPTSHFYSQANRTGSYWRGSTGTHLKATVTGEPYNSTRHALSSAIKAVTWHEACVQPADEQAGSYKARIIFDI